MEIRKLLNPGLINPELYDILRQRKNWLNYDPADWSELHELLTEFDIDPVAFDQLADQFNKFKWYAMKDVGDNIQKISTQDNYNLHKIKQAIDNIDQYRDITIKLKLDTGKAGGIHEINVTATEAIQKIYEALKSIDQAPVTAKKTGPVTREINNTFAADIITLSFCFLNKHSQQEYIITKRRYFAGLVLAAIGYLDLPKNFNGKYNNNYQKYLTKKVKQFIDADKTTPAERLNWYMQFTKKPKAPKGKQRPKNDPQQITTFTKQVVEKSLKQAWG